MTGSVTKDGDKVIRLSFPPSWRPTWLKEDVHLEFPTSPKEPFHGKQEVLIDFSAFEEGFELPSSTPALLEELMSYILSEQYAPPMKPITSFLPFPYHILPAKVRLAAAWALFVPKRFARKHQFPQWPIEPRLETVRHLIQQSVPSLLPFSWPHDKKYAICFTHDVESARGVHHALKFATLEEAADLRGCYYIVSGEFPLDEHAIQRLIASEHEIGSHDDQHDNTIAFVEPETRQARLSRCRARFAKLGYSVQGFRSPSLYRTPELFHTLAEQFAYDSSVCDSDLEWIRGCGSVYPYRIGKLVELPITLPMDASMIYMDYRYNQILKLWLKKLNWIREVGGVATVVTHTEEHLLANSPGLEMYRQFLSEIKSDTSAWFALPMEIADWVRYRSPQSGNINFNEAKVSHLSSKRNLEWLA